MTAPNLSEPPKPPETPGSSGPVGGTPPAPTEWRVPDTDPRVWARGKTASEILNLTEQAVGAVQQLSQQPAYQPPPPQPAFDPMQVRDDDYVDGRTLKTYLQTVANPVAQRFQQVDHSLAQFAEQQVRSKYADAFARYGPEIVPLVANIPPHARTVDNLSMAVELVLGRHIQDERRLAQAEVAPPMDPTGRSYGAPGSPASLAPGRLGRVTESDELPADYRDLLKQKNITDETVREFCAMQGISLQQWVDTAKKHNMNVITERGRRG